MIKITKLSANARIGELADTATALINTYGTSGITCSLYTTDIYWKAGWLIPFFGK